MGYLNEERVSELWEKIKNTFARKNDIPALPDLEEPLAQTLAEAKTYADATYQQSTGYTDQKIADLIGGAPETLDTLAEVADAIAEHKSVVTALDAAIGKKADAAEVDAHTKNGTIHITASERTAWTNKLDKTGDASNVINIFTAASSLTALTSKEKLSVSLGKLAKAVSTLISHIATTATASVAGHVKVDTALSATSTNPVQNKAVQAKIESLQSSFQAGCDTIYNRCITCGVTPSAKTPAAIAAAIQLVRNNAITAGKNSIKVFDCTVGGTLTLNKPFEILIPGITDNVRRILGYFIINGITEAGIAAAAFTMSYPSPVFDGSMEDYVMLYMHQSNGTKIWLSGISMTVKQETTEVNGIGTRMIKTMAGGFYKIETLLSTDGKWDADSIQMVSIKGDRWNALTANKDRTILIIYEAE